MDIPAIKFPYTGTQILGGILVVNTVLVGAGTQLTDLFGPAMTNHILAICSIGTGICGGFLMKFGSMTNQFQNVQNLGGVDKIMINGQVPPEIAAQALSPADPKVAATPESARAVAVTASKVAAVLIALVLAGALLTPGGANAAQLRPLTGNIKKDFSPVATTPVPAVQTPLAGLQSLMDQLSKVQAQAVIDIVADFNAADADAATLTNPTDPASFRDPISHACYPAAVKFMQSLPASTPPTGTLVAVQLFQKKRDFVAQIQAGLPVYLKLGCAPLLGDEAAIFTKLMGLLGVNVALNTILPGSGALSALAF